MRRNRPINGNGGPLPKPRPQDFRRHAPIARREEDMQLVAIVRAKAGNRGPAHLGRRRQDSKPMERTEKAELRAIGDPATPDHRRAANFQPSKMPPNPWLALRQELLDIPVGASPTPPSSEGDGHDDAVTGIDRDPEGPRPR